MTPAIVHAHKLVRATAIEMAGALYEEVMKDNLTYATWKAQCPELTPTISEIMFIELLYPRLLERARQTLAGMLATNISDVLKEEISEALIADQRFRAGRLRREAQRAQQRLDNGRRSGPDPAIRLKFRSGSAIATDYGPDPASRVDCDS